MGDIAATIDLLTRGGLVTALVLALVGGMRGWYVWKNVHDASIKYLSDQLVDMRKDRDFWREQAIRAMNATSTAIKIVDTVQKTGE